ncbi:MAG: peptidyl-prolyl cis-trans isomerase [Candidatus Binatia bacterium]
MRCLRSPLVHFLAGGAVLFVLVHAARPAAVGGVRTAPNPVVITADDVARMRTAYTRETGLQPTAADEVALIEKAVEEELLYREAVARGLDRNDRSIRNWLIEQMRSLADDPKGDDDALYAQARALELDRKDLVVRRILMQKMRLLASRAGEQDAGDDELRAFYAAHQADYQQPERVSLWHIFLGAQAHGTGARREAVQLVAELRNRPLDPSVAARRGDPFPVPAHLTSQSRSQLEKIFGPTLAVELMRGAARTWIGPLMSPYGEHLVWIETHDPGGIPPFEAVRGRVLEAWRDERRAQRLAQLLRELASRAVLRIDSVAWRERRQA